MHYDDVIMGAIASLITSLTIVHSTVYSARWIPHTKPSNVENVSIWWRHHGLSSTAHSISLEAVPYLRWTWRLIHMKSIWNHICIPSHEICVLYVRIYCELRMNFIWSSYELHMEFKWTCYEFHMKLDQIYSYEFTCSSYEIHMNFITKN